MKTVVTNIKLSSSSLKVRQNQHPALAIIVTVCLFAAKEIDSSCSKVTVPDLTFFSGKASGKAMLRWVYGR